MNLTSLCILPLALHSGLPKQHTPSAKICHSQHQSCICHPDQHKNRLILTGPSAHLFSHQLICVCALRPLLTSI